MKPISKLAASVTFIAFLACGAAMAKCTVAEDSERWHFGMNKNHHIYDSATGPMETCNLTLFRKNDPTFRITGMWIDKGPKHGTLTAEFPSPWPGNYFGYQPNPGFKGDEVVIVHFDTERNGQPWQTMRSTWRITVQ